jgi:hypothetical protein
MSVNSCRGSVFSNFPCDFDLDNCDIVNHGVYRNVTSVVSEGLMYVDKDILILNNE